MPPMIEVQPPTPNGLERIQELEETIRLLSVISHEINNPLTALLGRAQILRSKVHGDPRAEKAAQVVEESASRLVDLAKEMSRILKDARARDGAATPEPRRH